MIVSGKNAANGVNVDCYDRLTVSLALAGGLQCTVQYWTVLNTCTVMRQAEVMQLTGAVVSLSTTTACQSDFTRQMTKPIYRADALLPSVLSFADWDRLSNWPQSEKTHRGKVVQSGSVCFYSRWQLKAVRLTRKQIENSEKKVSGKVIQLSTCKFGNLLIGSNTVKRADKKQLVGVDWWVDRRKIVS